MSDVISARSIISGLEASVPSIIAITLAKDDGSTNDLAWASEAVFYFSDSQRLLRIEEKLAAIEALLNTP